MKVQTWCKLLLLIAFTAAFCSGCWDRKEFNQLAIAQAIAIDYEEEQYRITVQLLMPNAVEETASSESIWVIEGEGASVGDALEQLSFRAPREVYLNHLDIVLLGEGLLQKDMGGGLEYLMRQSVLRRRTSLLAVEGNAGDILRAKAELADVDIYYLTNLIHEENRRVKDSETILNDYYLAMDNKIAEGLVIPRVEVQDDKAIQIQGGAVILQNKLLRWADQPWMTTYYWVTGGKEILTLKGIGSQDSDVTVRIHKRKCKWELAEDDPMQVRVKLNAVLYIIDNDMHAKNLSLEEVAAFNKKVQAAVEQQLVQQMEAYLAQAQQEGCDTLRLGRWLRAYHPELLDGKEWPEVFAQLQFDVQLETKIEMYELK